MIKNCYRLSKFMFATQSVPGHAPPQMADTPSGRYAGSLFTVASKSQALQFVLDDLYHLKQVIQSQQSIKQFLKNSSIKRKQQGQILTTFAKENYHDITTNFLDALIQNGRLGDLQKTIDTYISYCKILNKEQDIRIISAKQLSDEEKMQVVDAYKTNKPDVKFKVTYEVDSQIMGGLQIYAGTQFLDCSLRSRMQKLKSELGKIA